MKSYFFHPYELSFGGYSDSGKTTLISRLIQRLSQDYEVAYIKHDIHCFQMDNPSKDTFKAYAHGASNIFISDPAHYAYIHRGAISKTKRHQIFLEADFALIEGYKRSEIPKIILIDREEKILEEFRKKKLSEVIGFVGERTNRKDLQPYPYFHKDDLSGITDFVLKHMRQRAEDVPLYGLVLAGGKSRRMKKDKSLLNYHGMPQVTFCAKLLENFCERVFVSNRQQQAQLPGHHQLPQINDVFLDMGPMGGILSAMKAYPQAAWLILACDLPFITKELIRELLSKRNPFKYATSYQSDHNAFPEPLCAVYEPKMYPQLLNFLSQGYQCPRKVLINSNIVMLPQKQKHSLDNINHPEEYQRALKAINQK